MTQNKSKLHLGIIPDGNRRWASLNKLNKYDGHRKGVEVFHDVILSSIGKHNIDELTIYALSTENKLNRSAEELKTLFGLFGTWYTKIAADKRIKKHQVRIKFVGDLSILPENIRKKAIALENKTKHYNKYTVNIALAYGGLAEIKHAAEQIAKKHKADKLTEITENDLLKHAWLTKKIDLVIRTGGQIRTSNFFPLQTQYAEWFFLDKFWPDFTEQDLKNCVNEFHQRQKNFGK